MQLPPDVVQCVSFVGYEKRAVDGSFDRHFAGTGFFISVKLSEPATGSMYLFVTARHVVEAAQKSGTGKIYLRINNMKSASDWIEVPESAWRFHLDSSVDLALRAVAITTDADMVVIPDYMIATPEIIAKWGIGPADDVFITGLFTEHPGKGRNSPIIRSGNIASMPTERMRTKQGSIDAYLIESRSIGGLSGSPVFVHLGYESRKYITDPTLPDSTFFLLGVIRGHGDVLDAICAEDSIPSNEKLNMGIAVVTPASKIADMLNYDEIVTIRKNMGQRSIEAQNLPTDDNQRTKLPA